MNRDGRVSTGEASALGPHFLTLSYETDFASDADGEVTPLHLGLIKPLFGHVAP